MVLGGLLVAITLGLAWLAFGRTPKAQVVMHAPPTTIEESAAGVIQPTAAPEPTATPADVTVFVAGSVARPGVYKLAGGTRLLDALDAAGGLLPTAAAENINLAILLRDEAMIYVPAQGETVAPPQPGATVADRGLTVDVGSAPGIPVNINRAGADELMELPGIGPAKAQAIIANRPFASVDDLDRVPGIGPATLEVLRPLVTAP